MAEIEIPVASPPVDPSTGSTETPLVPFFKILLNGQDLAKNQFVTRIVKIEVEETDDGADLAKVMFLNLRGEFTNDPLFQEGSIMEVSLGNLAADIVQHGVYTLKRPTFDAYPDGRIIVTLSGVGELVKLASEEKRRSWERKRDSEIAAEIAQEYRLKTDIERTPSAMSVVVQAGITDYAFLSMRAALYGYQLYVHNGVLHFHPVRQEDLDIELIYRSATGSNVISYTCMIDTYRNGQKYTISRYDPASGDLYSVESADTQDPLTKNDLKLLKGEDVRSTEDITGLPQAFISGLGHDLTEVEAQRIVDAAAVSSRFVVRMNVETRGHEKLEIGKTVRVFGLQKLSGAYYIKKCAHLIGDGYYKTILDLRRSLTGELAISPSISYNDSAAAGVRDTTAPGDAPVGAPTDDFTPKLDSERVYDDRTGRFLSEVP